MLERIKNLRKSMGMTQREFGQKLNLTDATIAAYENGRREITSRVISDICRVYGVNEIWLRTGEGEMHDATTPAEEIIDFVGRIITDADPKFVELLGTALSRLDSDDLKHIQDIVLKITKEKEDQD